MSCSFSVLRVLGPDLQMLDQLRSALARHFQNPSDRDDDDYSSSASTLVLTNRYFTAVIGLHSLLEDPPDADVSKEDGVILVVESRPSEVDSPTTSFDTLTGIHESAEGCGKAGDLLRLCVAVTTPSGTGASSAAATTTATTAADEYSRRILWCLDRGYEYVEVDLSDDGVRRGHDDRDKEGFARVVEALHTTVWSSAVMHPQKQRELRESYDLTKQRHTAVPPDSSEGEPETTDNAYEPPDPSLLASTVAVEVSTSDDERVIAARQALLVGMETAEDDTPPMQENMDPSLVEEHRRERYFDSFESALREAGRIRELSRAGELSDDDRRKRAGDAASLLMDLMGKMGGFDESESEPEEDDVET